MFFYRRIFVTGNNRALDIASWLFIGIVIVWALSFFWATVFLCDTSFHYWWTNLENQTKCGDTVMEMKALAVSDVVTDFLILSFPMPLIWRLQMSVRQKMGVTAIFLIGTLYTCCNPSIRPFWLTMRSAVAASVTRLVIFVQALSVEFASTTDEDCKIKPLHSSLRLVL